MNRFTKLIAILLFLVPTIVYSASYKEEFNDDTLLAQAVLDIEKMSIDELNSFVCYFASCETYKGGQTKEFFCGRDRKTYLIKYERGRSIDKIINALAIMWEWIEASDKVAKQNSGDKKEAVKAIARYADITNKMKEAANKRFQQLSTNK